MKNNITIINSDNLYIPEEKLIQEWIEITLKCIKCNANITVNTFTKQDIKQLNHKYRQIDKPTNVLAFPYPEQHGLLHKNEIIGDLAICPDVIVQEAKQQNKLTIEHFAHIIIHGVLHIAGYTHENDQNANIMENLEREILSIFKINDPYKEEKHDV